MKVILTEKVKSLGNIGEIVNVAAGYARNFLFPRQVAVLADARNQKILDAQTQKLARKIQAEKDFATALKKKIDGLQFEVIKKVGSNGKLFGTVTSTEISKLLEDKQIEVERRIISVPVPIKQVGNFDVNVKLFADVEATFKIKVVMDPKQVEEMKMRQAEALARKAQKAKDAKDAEAAAKLAEETAQSEE